MVGEAWAISSSCWCHSFSIDLHIILCNYDLLSEWCSVVWSCLQLQYLVFASILFEVGTEAISLLSFKS